MLEALTKILPLFVLLLLLTSGSGQVALTEEAALTAQEQAILANLDFLMTLEAYDGDLPESDLLRQLAESPENGSDEKSGNESQEEKKP